MSTEGILLNQLPSSGGLKIKRVFFSTTELNTKRDFKTYVIPTVVSLPFEINPSKTLVFINGGSLVGSSTTGSYPDEYIGSATISKVESNAITFYYNAVIAIDNDSETQIGSIAGGTINWSLIEFE